MSLRLSRMFLGLLPRRLVVIALLLSQAGFWRLQIDPASAGEKASPQEEAALGAGQQSNGALAVSPSDHHWSQNPGLLQRITDSPHGYFRFINRRFAQAVCLHFAEEMDILPTVNLHGDAHLENYAVTNRQRGLADFDDATAGPYVLDLVRFGVSLNLASRSLGWGDQADEMVSKFLEGYRAGLQYGDLATPEPALARRIRDESHGGRRELLAVAEALMEPVDTTRQDFAQALEQYILQMHEANPQLPPGFFKIRNLGEFKLGIGSALSEKYLMRVEGPSEDPEDDVILEAKAVRDLDGIDCIQRPRVSVSRVAVAQARLALQPPYYVGYVVLHPKLGFDRREKFWVFAWDENYVEVSISRSFETPGDLFDVARDVGVQLGRGHPKSIADPYEATLRRALMTSVRHFEADIVAAIRDLTDQTVAAWQRFREEASAAAETRATSPD